MPALFSGGRHYQGSSLYKHPWKASSEQETVSTSLTRDVEIQEAHWKSPNSDYFKFNKILKFCS